MESLEPLPGVGVLAARIALAALFALGGLSKLSGPDAIATAMVRYRLFRKPNRTFAYFLGVAEAGTAVFLLSPPPFAALGCIAAGLLSLGFVAISVPALLRGDRFACGCLFGQARLSWVVVPVRGAAMAVAAVIGGVGPLVVSVPVPAAVPAAVGLAAIALGFPLAVRVLGRMFAVGKKVSRA
ncbi:MauE/DoxX family redox-associated membrane protein [Amycolatopsis sp. NPDC054798]